jgi:hypothetical protein
MAGTPSAHSHERAWVSGDSNERLLAEERRIEKRKASRAKGQQKKMALDFQRALWFGEPDG